MLKRLQDKKGISLIEIMASMIIFSLGLLMLIPMMVTSITANNFANNMSRATLFAQEKLEELRNAPVLASGNDVIQDMNRTWTVENVATNLKKLTVNVNWQDVMGRSHHVQSITYEVR